VGGLRRNTRSQSVLLLAQIRLHVLIAAKLSQRQRLGHWILGQTSASPRDSSLSVLGFRREAGIVGESSCTAPRGLRGQTLMHRVQVARISRSYGADGHDVCRRLDHPPRAPQRLPRQAFTVDGSDWCGNGSTMEGVDARRGQSRARLILRLGNQAAQLRSHRSSQGPASVAAFPELTPRSVIRARRSGVPEGFLEVRRLQPSPYPLRQLP